MWCLIAGDIKTCFNQVSSWHRQWSQQPNLCVNIYTLCLCVCVCERESVLVCIYLFRPIYIWSDIQLSVLDAKKLYIQCVCVFVVFHYQQVSLCVYEAWTHPAFWIISLQPYSNQPVRCVVSTVQYWCVSPGCFYLSKLLSFQNMNRTEYHAASRGWELMMSLRPNGREFYWSIGTHLALCSFLTGFLYYVALQNMPFF